MEVEITEEGTSNDRRQEDPVMLDWGTTEERRQTILVGKLQTKKKMNKNTVVAMIQKAWNLSNGVQILEVEENGFMFKFEKEEECGRIMRGRPWSIQGTLLIIQKCPQLMVYQEVKFDSTPIWVQFHNIPFEGMNQNNVEKLGKIVGEVVCFENPIVKGKMMRTFLRARILVDVQKPLVTGVWIPRPGRGNIWINIKYEKLQNYCYKCGVLAHEPRECTAAREMDSNNPTQPKYGPWVGTQPLKTWEEAIIFSKKEWESEERRADRTSQEEPNKQQQPWRGESETELEKAREGKRQRGKETAREEEGTVGEEDSRQVKDSMFNQGGRSQRVDEDSEPQKQQQRWALEMGQLEEQKRITVGLVMNQQSPMVKSQIKKAEEAQNDLPEQRIEEQRIKQKGIRIEELSHVQQNNQEVEYIVEIPTEEEGEERAMVLYQKPQGVLEITRKMDRMNIKRKSEDEQSMQQNKKLKVGRQADEEGSAEEVERKSPGQEQRKQKEAIKRRKKSKWKGPQEIKQKPALLINVPIQEIGGDPDGVFKFKAGGQQEK